MAAEAYDILLQLLAPDLANADLAYRQLRVKLTRFFESYGCPFAEDCADETIQRGARKLAAGVQLQASDAYLYFRGVARNVLFEQWKHQERRGPGLDELAPQQHPSINPGEVERRQQERLQREKLLDCLEGCLADLPPESRSLFLEYHQEAGATKIDQRAVLAERLGIELTALRNRITRLRKKLEACAQTCAQH